MLIFWNCSFSLTFPGPYASQRIIKVEELQDKEKDEKSQWYSDLEKKKKKAIFICLKSRIWGWFYSEFL